MSVLLALCLPFLPLLRPHRNALTLLGHLFLTMGRHGVPRAIRTDNDAVFKHRMFRTGLRLAGFATSSRRPAARGRTDASSGSSER